jgi:hypothetical protein
MNRARRRVGPLAAGLLWNLGRITARPTSRYQTGAHALLRVAQDVVKEGKGQDPEGPRPWPTQLEAVLLAPSIRLAGLIPAATIAPFLTAARFWPAVPVARTATYFTSGSRGSIPAEVTAFLIAATPRGLGLYRFGVRFPRPDEAKCGGHKGSAGKLYRSSPRDGAGIQTQHFLSPAPAMRDVV